MHRAQRDRLSRTIRDLGAEPVAAAPAYDLPEPLDSEIDVQRAAQDLEQRCAATYAAQVAQTVGDERRWAIGALTGAAVRRLALGGDAEAFPGPGRAGGGMRRCQRDPASDGIQRSASLPSGEVPRSPPE